VARWLAVPEVRVDPEGGGVAWRLSETPLLVDSLHRGPLLHERAKLIARRVKKGLHGPLFNVQGRCDLGYGHVEPVVERHCFALTPGERTDGAHEVDTARNPFCCVSGRGTDLTGEPSECRAFTSQASEVAPRVVKGDGEYPRRPRVDSVADLALCQARSIASCIASSARDGSPQIKATAETSSRRSTRPSQAGSLRPALDSPAICVIYGGRSAGSRG
jgi:hypothetical protein